MTTPTPKSNEDWRITLASMIGAEFAEMRKGNFDFSIIEPFVSKLLEAKDSYWKWELKRVVESVPDTEVEPYALANGFRRQFEDGYNCAIDKVQTWKTEQLKNLNGI